MTIQAIRLQRFRGFLDATIELKPLTVLLGPNSAGKSAFGQALAAMAHAHRLYAGAPQATLTPRPEDADRWPIDLGSTADLRTQGTDGPVKVGLQTAEGWVQLGFGFGVTSRWSDLRISYIAHPYTASSAPESTSVQARTDARPPVQSGVVPVAPQGMHELPPLEVERNDEAHWFERDAPVSVLLDGLIIKEVQHPTRTIGALSRIARDDFRSLLTNLTYLRATRKRSSRAYPAASGQPPDQEIGYAGQYAAAVLLNKGSNQVPYWDPPPIPDIADEGRTPDYRWAPQNEPLLKAVGTWLSKLGLARSVESRPSPTGDRGPLNVRVALADQQAHDITEVGFGVSQVLPVLVAGLLQPEGSLFIVDLPEAHLHPRPQGDLADFFCSLALSRRTSLVETHSEMFFHRLRLRAEMEPSLMDSIAVYFIDPPKEGLCCVPRRVGLSFDDELHWPPGFLQEAWETEAQIRAVREAKTKSK